MFSFWTEIFTDPLVMRMSWGTALLCLSAALVGVFTFLQKRSLLGDAIAHSLLPGICVGFMLAGYKNPWVLFVGALLSGWLGIGAVDLIKRWTKKLHADTALAIVLSVFFGLGVFLLSIIQQSGNPNQAGLDRFLFGNAAAMSAADMQLILLVSALIFISIFAGFRAFSSISFDFGFSASIGFPVKIIQFSLSSLTVFTIAIGVQALGVILVAAILIAPAAAARMWTHHLSKLLPIAAGIGLISGLLGAWVSYQFPAMPTGPWIVCICSFIVFFSLIFAPKSGLYARMSRVRKARKKILHENVLKVIYQLAETTGNFNQAFSFRELLKRRNFKVDQLKQGLKSLKRKNLVLFQDDNKVYLSNAGLRQAKQVVRNHRLWELYLTSKVGMQADHVHEDAEAMEHLITPEIEKQLEKLLGNPELDPHQTIIPKVDEG